MLPYGCSAIPILTNCEHERVTTAGSRLMCSMFESGQFDSANAAPCVNVSSDIDGREHVSP